MRFLRSVLAAPFPAAGSTISVAPPPRPSIAAAAPGAAQPLLRLTRPDDLDSPFCDVNFGPLCTRLSVENLLRLFGAMLAESRIVFLSSKLSRLSARRCTLEYPFVWGKGGTTRVLEYSRLAMGFANVRASRYGIR